MNIASDSFKTVPSEWLVHIICLIPSKSKMMGEKDFH